MFKVKMDDARLWKDMISAISTLIDEANFTLNPEGIKLRAMDPSHVAMVDFELPNTVFDEYACEEPARLGININEMLKLLRRARKDESIELSLKEEGARLSIVIKNRYTRTFSMSTLDIVREEVPTPKVTFNAKARVTTACLRDVLDDASTVSDYVRLEMEPERLVVSATGDLGSVAIEISKDSGEVLGLEVKEGARANFSLNYLSEMVKAGSAVSEVATVEFSTDMPIRMNFEMPQQGHLQYYLAPRIEGT